MYKTLISPQKFHSQDAHSSSAIEGSSEAHAFQPYFRRFVYEVISLFHGKTH